MKKSIFFLILLVAFSTKIFAQNGGMLRVTTTDRSVIKITIDERHYKKAGRSLTVGNLPRGRHWLEVYYFTNNNERQNRRAIIYQGYIKIHKNEMASCVIDASTGNIDIQRGPADSQTQRPRENEDDVYKNPQSNSMLADTSTVTSPPNLNVISDDELNKLGKKVSDKVTDTEKMKKMKAGLKDKTVSTAQVATMFSWLNFESTRVDFAEWAYSITADKENYKQLENKFTFATAKQKLEDYINSQKK